MKCVNGNSTKEHARLKALYTFDILDTEPEQDYNDIVGLAADLCHAPMALISFVDHDRQWFKASIGLGLSETSREVSFCSHAIQQDDIFIIPDALEDVRFSQNPLVTLAPGIRFYIGIPLTTQEGYSLGTLCVMDNRPRTLTATQIKGLRVLGRQVMRQLVFGLRVAELKSQKVLLQDQNKTLHFMNQELQLSETEIRSNLEEICTLKQNLELQERQYRELVENANDLIYELDADGKFMFCNRAMEQSVGFTREELSRKIYWELVHPADHDTVIQFYKQQRKDRVENSYLQFRLYSRRGEEVWVGQNVRMFFRENGYVYRVNAISRDITALKQTEHKLKRSEKRFRLLSEHAPVGIFQTDSAGKCVYVNKRWCDISGITEQQAAGDGWINAIHPDDRDNVFNEWHSAMLEHREYALEFRFVTSHGQVRWVTSRALQLTDAGEPIGYMGTVHDITELKEAQEKLADAKSRAEEATLAKSQFLSRMSHEIRTPMNGVIGLTNLLLQQNPRGDQSDHLNLLKFSGMNLLSIINDILDFSKVEAGKMHLEVVDFDLRALLARTKSLLEPRATEKGIVLGVTYDESLPGIVMGDPFRLTQIVNNLISNAIKFTEGGEVQLAVANKGMEDGKYKFQFTIRDTGIGIDASKVDSIFEPFAQADDFTARKFGGTGLGLSITKSLVELMGSKITVQSEPGHGSTFGFDLLLEECKVKQPHRVANPLHDLSSLGLTILVVDDNYINQVVAAKFLESWGVQVDLAGNGKEALEMVQQKKYQLILMDIQMPVMDGYEATRSIRLLNDSYYQTIPIFALTASVMQGMRDTIREAGMNDFIAKPFIPDELYSKIRQHVHGTEETIMTETYVKLDLDRYVNGDLAFRHKLSQLFVASMDELQQSIHHAIHENDVTRFRQALHKSKMPIKVVSNPEFIRLVERMSKLITLDIVPWEELKAMEKEFTDWCHRITHGLPAVENL